MAGVTPNGIHYPDGASKAKNLGPELEVMAHDIDTYIGSYLQPNGPIRQIVIDIAEDVVPTVVDDEITLRNLVGAYPDDHTVTYSTSSEVPLMWVEKSLDDPYLDTYADVYDGSWVGSTQRRGDVPILSQGKIDDAQIPDWVASKADMPEPEPEPEPIDPITFTRFISPDLPILSARVAAAAVDGGPVSLAFAGSSTTRADPGYVAPLTALFQQVYPASNPSTPQWERGEADPYTVYTRSGVHAYATGQGGGRADNYLTQLKADNLLATDPALFFHMVGSNDYTQQTDPATYETELRNQLAYLDANAISPIQHVLVHAYARPGFTPATYEHEEYLARLEAIAADRPQDTVLIDLSSAYRAVGIPGDGSLSDPIGLISNDSVHQNERGYRNMAQLLAGRLLA